MNSKIKNAAEILWDYNQLHQELPREVDAIVGLGCCSLAVAQRAVDLYNSGLSGRILFSGGTGIYSQNLPQPEAELFANYAESRGVPRTALITETRSRNTGENMRFSHDILAQLGAKSLLFVTVPFHERRTSATFEAQYPDSEVVAAVTSQRMGNSALSFSQFADRYHIEHETLATRVADATERIRVYPERGWMTPQPMGHEVIEALERVHAAGLGSALPSMAELEKIPLAA
jgi:uncharacterized SAM-binding protein YcdF (DUF218 family)